MSEQERTVELVRQQILDNLEPLLDAAQPFLYMGCYRDDEDHGPTRCPGSHPVAWTLNPDEVRKAIRGIE